MEGGQCVPCAQEHALYVLSLAGARLRVLHEKQGHYKMLGYKQYGKQTERGLQSSVLMYVCSACKP